jgi:uncharacterized protein DUF1203
MTTATATFLVETIPPQALDAVREAGRDQAGNPFRPFASGTGDEPLRCCLRLSRAGEQIALIAYQPPGGAGAYHETGPVFVHAASCEGYPAGAGWPPDFRSWRQVLRAYDHDGRIAGALLVDGTAAELGIATLLDDPRVAMVQSRNVLYGCYMFSIHRRS